MESLENEASPQEIAHVTDIWWCIGGVDEIFISLIATGKIENKWGQTDVFNFFLKKFDQTLDWTDLSLFRSHVGLSLNFNNALTGFGKMVMKLKGCLIATQKMYIKNWF
jgi:hypothetical protein